METLNFKNTVNLCGYKVEIARERVRMMLNDLPAQKALPEEAYQQKNWDTARTVHAQACRGGDLLCNGRTSSYG